MLTNNSDPKTNIPIRLIDTSKKRKIANIDLFCDNDDDDNTTVVIFIAFIFSYLLIYFVLKHIYISLGNNTWIIATIIDRKSTRLNSSHLVISYAVFCLKKKKK